ncbi:MAG TPA: hypothetical protein VHD87_01410 [Acidimicrobiales bacterium]|nr:hypothetical protein [Acidimicrobiales bacterium]
MPRDARVDPHRLPSVTGAEAKQEAKAEFIPGWALGGIALVIVGIVLLAVLG